MEPSFLCCGKRWQITVSRFPSHNLLVQNVNKELIKGYVVNCGKYARFCVDLLGEAGLSSYQIGHVYLSNNANVTIDRIAVWLISF